MQEQCKGNAQHSPARQQFEREWAESRADILGRLSLYVTDNFGYKCDTYEPSCACCEMWKMYERIAEITE